MTIDTIESARRRRLVAIESPLAAPTDAEVEANKTFARKVCRLAIDRGYAPFAMHLFFTQFLDDDVEEERQIGLDCGLAWTSKASERWFCLREGEAITPGMQTALDVESARKGMAIPPAGARRRP